ncbi:PT domain-containing protein [Streptomyces sp. 184]|uniref:PT domain-containing protein n=1 Tax=Streptomyces sp. 184 TaxID=1827526 RepID=UPI003892992F
MTQPTPQPPARPSAQPTAQPSFGDGKEATKHDRTMFRLMNDPAGRPVFATTGRRRAVVGAHVALTGATLACTTLLYTLDGAWLISPLAVLLVAWMVATGFLNGGTRGLLELRTRMLDERQLAERDRARAVAHRAATALLAVAAGVLVLAEAAGADGLPGVPAVWVLVYALAATWLMPLWVAGLQARDEPAEESEFGEE